MNFFTSYSSCKLLLAEDVVIWQRIIYVFRVKLVLSFSVKLIGLGTNRSHWLTRNRRFSDQDGAPVDLPKGEQKALILAMSYHEKGRAAMKAGDFDLALVFLLEADVQYKACRADILKVVDNFG